MGLDSLRIPSKIAQKIKDIDYKNDSDKIRNIKKALSHKNACLKRKAYCFMAVLAKQRQPKLKYHANDFTKLISGISYHSSKNMCEHFLNCKVFISRKKEGNGIYYIADALVLGNQDLLNLVAELMEEYGEDL